MSQIHRRRFLQLATGFALATIGLNHLDIMRLGDRYGRVLAQSTNRKLALLVGINEYASELGRWNRLYGCVNDVLLQRELLIHRFGFVADDIMTLMDQQATRTGILTAFEEHLLKQAKAGDVVVFHYSGHGSRVVDPNPYRADHPLNSTFVPIDSPLPDNFRETGAEVRDIMGGTLFVLRNALPTEQMTMVLDSCHAGGGKRGTVTIRSREGATSDHPIHPSPEELENRDRLIAEYLGWSPQEFGDRRRNGNDKGVIIASAAETELAADVDFRGFPAGAFTYAMTQYLWQSTGDQPVGRVFGEIAEAATQYAYDLNRIVQMPNFDNHAPTELTNAPIYFIPNQPPAAEAVVTQIEGDRVKLWLGGVHPNGLESLNEAIFTALDAQAQEIGTVKLTEREGLNATGQLMKQAEVEAKSGLFLQEQIRTVPKDLSLAIGLDSSLGSGMSEARQALASIAQIQAKSLADGAVDYILGRMIPEYVALQRQAVEMPPIDSVGLFYPDLSILPNSFAEPGEAVSIAVDRLRPKFSLLLSARLLRVLVNPNSSQLSVVAALIPVGANAEAIATPLMVRGARGAVLEPIPVSQSSPDASRLPLDTLIRMEVKNNETRSLHINVLLIDPAGEILVLFPTSWNAPHISALVEPGTTLRIPDPDRGDRFQIRLVPPIGIHEMIVIASATPLDNTLAALQQLAANRGIQRGEPLVGDAEFLSLTETLIADLDRGTRGVRFEPSDYNLSDAPVVSSEELAALSIGFELYI
ncbi:MAG: DUF4384 domain-containing protein [Cyanobacteria bacterium CRU_2_1]|nr:DUF4384 domain-containing protein [Cyanobacteria bacterium CRU_2_1]